MHIIYGQLSGELAGYIFFYFSDHDEVVDLTMDSSSDNSDAETVSYENYLTIIILLMYYVFCRTLHFTTKAVVIIQCLKTIQA